MEGGKIVIFVLVVAAFGLVCFGCGGSSDSPKQVAEKLLQASMSEDADVVWTLISWESKEGQSKEELIAGGSESVDGYSVGEATVSGDKARVEASLDMVGTDRDMEFDMILFKEDGEWKVSLPDTNVEMEKAMEELLEELTAPQ